MTDPPPPTGPPPGWYPDPTTGHGYRWWDGYAWSDHTTETPGHQVTAGSGLQPASPWMSDLFRIATSRAGHFLPMVVLLMFPAALFNGIAVWVGLRNAVLTTNSSTGEVGFTNPGASVGTYGVMVLSLALSLVVWVLMAIVAARQASAVADERLEPWSDSMRDGIARLPRGLVATAPIIGAIVGTYLLVVIGAFLSPAIAVLVVLAALVVLPLLTVRLSLAQIGAALGPAGVNPVATSWQLTRGRFWAMAGRLALLVLITLTLSLLASFIATPFTALAGGGAAEVDPGAEELRFADLLGDNPAVFAIGQLFAALGNGAAAVMWATGLMLVYRVAGGSIDRDEDDRSE